MERIRFYSLWLAGIIILFFILQLAASGFTELLVLNSRAVEDFQVWRYLTAVFLHGSITHLLFNLFALLFFGLTLERLIGSGRFLAVFLVSGIIANIISVNFYTSSLGASGAIYGIIGAVAIIKPFMMVWAFGFIMPMFLMATFYVIADVLRFLGAFGVTNIGSIAHLSGIAVGAVMALLLRFRRGRKANNEVRVVFNEDSMRNWEDSHFRG